MSVGPVLQFDRSMVDNLPRLAADRNISLKITATSEAEITYEFSAWPARVVGLLKGDLSMARMWLVFPWSHAKNPLMWPFDMRLLRRIEKMLVENGAHHCDWNVYASTDGISAR